MTAKDVLVTTLFIAIAFVLGWISKPNKTPLASVETKTDTIWATVHDTCFFEIERKIERLDTVLLARVDTLLTTDSVLVEVPIERQEWAGENYNITTEGYRVQLKDVYFNVPTVTKEVTRTVVKMKHWGCGVGLQAGYGVTIHGMSPYAGVGVNVGYNF